MALKAASAGSKILRNSLWFGLETAVETIVFLATSIAVARVFGPEKLGYFSFINFFVAVITRTSGSGLSIATRKYMAEYLAIDKPGVARAVYQLAFRYQLIGAVLMSAVGLAGIFLFGKPEFRVMSIVLIVSLIPGVMTNVPAQANNAFEDLSKNTLSAFAYMFSYAVIIVLTLFLGWGLVGIASAQLVGRIIEVFLRSIPLNRRLRAFPVDPLPEGLLERVRRFCIQAIGLQLLASVIWDRSEFFFLQHFSTLTQLGFYSVSFGLASNLLVVPRTFGGATGVTLMVEAGRDAARVGPIVRNAVRFLLLVVIPVHLGAAAITSLAVRTVYGPKYIGAIPVLIVASLLALPRAFLDIPEILLRAADRQQRMIYCYILTAIVTIALDAALIPRYGAVGAAWGNGLGQTFGVVAIWIEARRSFEFHLPIFAGIKLSVAGLIMAALAAYLTRTLPGILGLAAAVLTAIPLYIVMVKLVHGLDASDRERLSPIGNKLPGRLREAFLATVGFVTPPPSS